MSDEIGLREYFDQKIDTIADTINGIGERISKDHDLTLVTKERQKSIEEIMNLNKEHSEKQMKSVRSMVMALLFVILTASTKDVWNPMIAKIIDSDKKRTELHSVVLPDLMPDCQKPGCTPGPRFNPNNSHCDGSQPVLSGGVAIVPAHSGHVKVP